MDITIRTYDGALHNMQWAPALAKHAFVTIAFGDYPLALYKRSKGPPMFSWVRNRVGPVTTVPFLTDIPPEIGAAAKLVAEYFDMQGIRGWQYMGVCDRRYANLICTFGKAIKDTYNWE